MSVLKPSVSLFSEPAVSRLQGKGHGPKSKEARPRRGLALLGTELTSWALLPDGFRVLHSPNSDLPLVQVGVIQNSLPRLRLYKRPPQSKEREKQPNQEIPLQGHAGCRRSLSDAQGRRSRNSDSARRATQGGRVWDSWPC